MNSAPLLLVPLAALALVSSQPSTSPATAPSTATDPALSCEQPDIQAIASQLKDAVNLLDLADREIRPTRHARTVRREVGLHTGHLEPASMIAAADISSGARGLTSEDEWQQTFPRYAAKVAAAR